MSRSIVLSFKVRRCLGLFIFINFILDIFKVLYCISVVIKIYNLSIYTSVDKLILWRRQSQKIIRTPRRSYSNFKMLALNKIRHTRML